MDYEKKYNEAMLRADEAVQKGCLDKDMFDIIFPPEESEDEMVRKWILEKVQGYADSGIPCSDEIQMANKALAWLEEQKDKNCLACDQHLKGYIAGRKATEEEKQKEQKPVELSGELSTNDSSNPSGLVARNLTPEQMREETLKPVEWSEKDEKIKERLITRLNWITYNTRTNGTSPNITFFDEIAWLKSLRPIVNANSEKVNVNWSEEDKDKLIQCIRIVTGWEADYDIVHSPYSNFLKSLRPGWKPSEEQMKALQNAVALTACDKELVRLYNQLKKL